MTAVSYLWAGAATTSSLQAVFCLDGSASVRAAFSTTADFAAPTYSGTVSTDANNFARPGDVTGLTADTRYYYAAEIDGALDLTHVGRARTQPLAGTIRMTFGSCWAGTGQGGATTPDHPVGAAVAAQDAHVHLFLGDLGYPNNVLASETPYRTNYALLHSSPNFALMASSVAFDYVWDDHDFGPDNSNSTAAGRTQAATVYRQAVPHHPLSDTGAIYHAFDAGPSVRVVVTDLRYYRSPDTDPDGPDKTMLGATQKQWLKDEWLAAKNAGKLIVWCSSSVWCIDGAYTTQGINADGDHWGAFTTERAELDDFRSENDVTDIMILFGDSHSIEYRLAVDYSAAQNVPAPCYGAAAYSRTPAYRPAAWDATSAPSDADGHYGAIEITPHPTGGWTVAADFHEVDVSTGADSIAFSAPEVSFSLAPPPLEAGLYAIEVDGEPMAVSIDGVPYYVQYG